MDTITTIRDNDEASVNLVYDKTRYSIEHVKIDNKFVFVIKRILNGRIIKVLDNNIGFIVEYDNGNNGYFFVSSYIDDGEKRSFKLSQYVDYYHLCDELPLINEIRINYLNLSDLNIDDCSAFMSLILDGDIIGTRYGSFRFGTSTSMMPHLTFAFDDLANNLDKLNKANIRFLASELFVEGRHKMTVEELKDKIKEILLTTKTLGSLDINNCLSTENPESNRLWSVDEFVKEYQNKTLKKTRKK